jgi:hypothetical protein
MMGSPSQSKFLQKFDSTAMLTIKRKQLICFFLLILGCGYFSTMSNLEINSYLKSVIFLLPMQLAAIVYVTYLRWNRS